MTVLKCPHCSKPLTGATYMGHAGAGYEIWRCRNCSSIVHVMGAEIVGAEPVTAAQFQLTTGLDAKPAARRMKDLLGWLKP